MTLGLEYCEKVLTDQDGNPHVFNTTRQILGSSSVLSRFLLATLVITSTTQDQSQENRGGVVCFLARKDATANVLPWFVTSFLLECFYMSCMIS